MTLVGKLKKNKSGFTLVEMIVVIVIIGILLAILVPGMFKYIDKAKDKQIMVNARVAYLNIEMAVAELYSMDGVTYQMIQKAFDTSKNLSKNEGMTLQAQDEVGHVFGVIKIEDFPNEKAVVYEVSIDEYTLEIEKMIYKEDGKVVEMEDKKWKEVKKEGVSP